MTNQTDPILRKINFGMDKINDDDHDDDDDDDDDDGHYNVSIIMNCQEYSGQLFAKVIRRQHVITIKQSLGF